MKNRVNPVSFRNKEGLRLFGILHGPEEAGKTGIIILNPGIKSRVGPHRLYIRMARTFCDLGFRVLRFDPHGIGDSEGDIEEGMAADFYGTVQVGRFVDDTSAAMDWMEKEFGTKRIILAGLCGGAITALHVGARDMRVEKVIGLGMPVSLNGSKVDPYRYMSRGQLEEIRRSYFRKLERGSAWLRFFSFRSDYRLIIKSLFLFLKDSAKNLQRWNNRPGQTQESNNNLNPLFAEVFHKVASDRRVLLVFSGADRLHWEFEEKYMQNYARKIQEFRKNIDIHIIKNANHILSFTEWQDEMLGVAISWLEGRYANSFVSMPH